MTSPQAIWLVARREVVERARSRAFQASVAVTLAIVALAAILPGLLGSDGPKTTAVGAVGPGALAVAEQAKTRARASDELRIDVRTFADESAARRALDAERVEVALVGRGLVLAAETPTEELDALIQTARREVILRGELAAAGVPPAESDRALNASPARVELLDASKADIDVQRNLAFGAMFLIYLAIAVYGIWVANGIVEEKSSRIVELLLSTIKPAWLLAGKIIGIGLLGLAQMALVTVVGLGLALATGAIELPETTWSGAGQILLWFVLGYAIYAALYAVSGALVARQEDLNASTTPLTLVLLLAFFVGFQVLQEPSGGLAEIATLVPFTAPIAVPARALLGELDTAQAVLAVLIALATTAGLALIATRIYASTVLQTAPVKVGAALRLLRA